MAQVVCMVSGSTSRFAQNSPSVKLLNTTSSVGAMLRRELEFLAQFINGLHHKLGGISNESR